LAKGGPVPPVPFSSPFSLSFPSPSASLPLEVYGPLNQLDGLGERCKLPQWGPGRSAGRKRIWCTLKLSESHWWHHFEYSEYHVLQLNDKNLALANMTVSDGVSPSPKEGGGRRSRLCPASKSATGIRCKDIDYRPKLWLIRPWFT